MTQSWHRCLILSLAGLAMVGCAAAPHQEQAKAPPKPSAWYPEWAYDAPFYFKPPPEAEPAPLPGNRADDAVHYFTNKRLLEIARPQSGVALERIPRIGVYVTNTSGYYWERAGYFGIGQTHFALPVENDGDYGIRFVGPGIPASHEGKAPPHRVYHVDTTPPQIDIKINPAKQWYSPGEIITVEWTATDRNPVEKSVRVAVCWDWEDPGANRDAATDRNPQLQRGVRWRMMPAAFDDEGALAYSVPAEAAGQGMRIQVLATDRAGNVGKAESPVLQIVESTPGSGEQEPAEQASAPVQAFAPVRAPKPAERVAVAQVRVAPMASAGVRPGPARFVACSKAQLAVYETSRPEHLAVGRPLAAAADVVRTTPAKPSAATAASPVTDHVLLRLAPLPKHAPGQRHGWRRPWESLDRGGAEESRMAWRLPAVSMSIAVAR